MDLPPPPPLSRRHHHHHDHHLRYENVLRPPDFVSSPYPLRLPPPPSPPQNHSSNILLPPPPPLPHPSLPQPTRLMSPPPPPPRFAFSPPRYPNTERSHRHEFDPPPKPYFHRTRLPPPPPPPPREHLPFRTVHKFPKRNPAFENENFPWGRNENIRELPENWDRNWSWRDREAHIRASDVDVGHRDRYRDVISESSGLYRERDDGRRRDSRISSWCSDLDNRRRDYDERRCDNGMSDWSRDLYRERDYNQRRRDADFDERRWDSGMNDRSRDLYREPSFDERRWDSGMNDRSRDLYREPSFDERRWDSGRNNQGGQFYSQVDDDERRRESSRSAGVLSRLGYKRPEFAENNLNSGGVLSRLGSRQSDKDLSFGGVLSRLGNRQPEVADDDRSLGRFNGRLGTVASKVELISPDKKKRLLKKNTLLRSQLGKVRSRHSGGFKSQHFAKESSTGSFNVNDKGSGKMQTRMEGNREREQSPMELAISFKSNALVAKAIQVPSHPVTELSEKSNSVKERLGYSASALPAAKPDVISNIQFDSRGTSKEHMDKAFDSGSGSVTGCPRDFGENTLENARLVMILKGSSIDRFEGTCSSWSAKKKRGKKRRFLGANPQMENDNHVIRIETSKSFGPSSAVNRFSAYEVACQAHENLPNESAGYGVSLGLNQQVNVANKNVQDKASAIDAEEDAVEPTGQYVKLGRDTIHDVSEHPDLSETVLLERSYTGGPSKDIVPINDHDSAGLLRPNETRISEVHEDNSFSEIYELDPSLKSDCTEMKMTEDAMDCDVGFKDANSEDPNQANTPQVILDAKDFGSSKGAAVAYCPNVAFDNSVSSCFLSANDRGTLPEFEVSFPDDVGTVISHSIYSIEGGDTSLYDNNSSLKVITDKGICLSADNSSKVIRKRKHGGAQMGLSGVKTNVNIQTVRSIDGGVARCLAKDIVPAMDGDFFCERDSCKEDSSLQESTSGEVHYSANGSFPGYTKKQKLSSPRSSLSSLSEDDSVANGFSTPPILEQHSTRPSEWGVEQSGDASPTSITIIQCGTTGVEGEVDIKDINVANLDENLVDGKRSFESDDLAFISRGVSCSDRNCPIASDSGDDSLASSFDRSCMTSPEELHLNSDSCSLGSTNVSDCLLDNEMICQSDNISNKKHVFAVPNTSSVGNCSGAAVNKLQTIPRIPPSLLKDTSQVVKKLYPVHSKLTWTKDHATSAITKVSPVQQPLKFSNTRKLYSSHATNSRTWCRAVNSPAAVAEPKLKPSPIPQSNGTKAASSYVRKGNSLVRKYSPSDEASQGFSGSSSSVYRLNRCTNTKKTDQATDYKTGDADALTLKRKRLVNTSEMTKAAVLNQSENSFSRTQCNLEKPVPASNPHSSCCPSKILDVMEDRIKSSLVSERQADSVINSDSQSTAAQGNSVKKIIYVKRRSNQLVATSDSDDKSILGVDNIPSQLSDGYYKSRENQLLRASSENHVKEGNANATASGLVSHPFIPKTSTRRQSGFAKSCRYSKFSFVWKLHDAQSSEKHKNFLGPRKVWPHLFSPKRAAYWRSLMLGMKPSLSNISQKLLVSRKRGAIYTRSSHGYSLKMSKVLSVGGSSLKWSKSIEKSSRKANEEATRAVAAAEKRKKDEKGAVAIASKSRNHVSRKWVLSVKLRPGERIFRIGSERYKMDPTRRTLQRITEKESSSSSSVAFQSKKTVKRSYIPRRLLIGNEEYVRIGNGNQLVRDPKKRIRVLASEKVRWSLRTARLRLARKRRYCQFFTRFGTCNKADGKCPYIHDPSKIVVCTKFLTGSCTNVNCKLTHKVIPERMQDCSYFLKGSCSNESCPYRHVHVNPDSSVCESFLRGYCADGNECPKKHTYVCPAFEATGVCPQASICKLHHPKKKPDKKSMSEQKVVRGRYFDGGLVGVDDDCCTASVEKLPSKGKDVHEGKFPDYISLEVSDDEILPDAQKDEDELHQIIVE